MAGRNRARLRALVAVLLVTLASEAAFAPVAIAAGATNAATLPIETPAPKDAPSELVDARTETSQTFDNHDGTLTTSFASDPIFYRPTGTEAFEPIELGFTPVAGADKAVRSAKAPVSLEVAPADDSRGVIALTYGIHRIALLPVPVDGGSRGSSEATTDGRSADVAGVFPGVALRIIPHAYGASTYLVVAAKPAVAAWTFEVDAPALTLVARRDGSLEFVDEAGTPIGLMPAPYAVDSTADELTGSGRTTTKVAYSLGQRGARQTVTVTVTDQAWLEAAAYPIYVDPVVTIYSAGSNAWGDAHVNQGNPTFSYANYQRPDSPYYDEMWLGESPSDSTYYNEAYIKFDLTSLAGMTIDVAELQVYPYHQYYNAPTATNTWLRRVTATWAENTITWNNKPAVSTSGVLTDGLVEGTRSSFIMTAMVQGWVAGTYSNHGLRLDENGNGPTYWKRLISSEYGSVNSPRMNITYHTAVPLPPSTPNLAAASDTGSSSTDNITNDTTPTFNGTAEADSTVKIYAGATLIGTDVAAGGNWSKVSSTLGAGVYSITATATNAGGTSSPSGALSVTIDTSSPTVSTFTAPSSPTGSLTLDYALTFSESVSGLAAADFAVTGTATGWTVSGVTGSGAGPYTVSLSSGTAGTVILTLNVSTVSDAAGNTGPGSASVAATVTVDRTLPTVSTFIPPSTPTASTSLAYSLTFSESISGLAAADFSITGTATGWTVSGITGTGSGPYTVTLGSGTAGTVILALNVNTVLDTAGNTGPASAAVAATVTVDRTAPTAPSAPNLEASSDSGASDTDNITNAAASLIFAGSAEANSTVHLFDGSTPVGTQTASGTGDWSIWATGTFADGSHSFTTTATDAAGNTSSASSPLSVMIDTTSPVTDFTAPDEASYAAQTAMSYSVAWTEQESGSGIAGRSLQQRRGAQVSSGTCVGVTWADDGAPTTGTSPSQALGLLDGQCYGWLQSVVDAAGNTSSSTSGSVRVGAPTTDFTVPNEGTTVLQDATGIPVVWIESGPGITSRSLQRQRGQIVTIGVCGDVAWADDGSPSSSASPENVTSLMDGFCYRWIQTLQYDVGTSVRTSGSVLVDLTAPFGTLFDPSTDIQQMGGGVAISWTEVEESSGVDTRQVQRQKMSAPSDGTCMGFNWVDDGPASQASSPMSVTGLLDGWCYRWSLFLTDVVGNASSTKSPTVMIDGADPTADFGSPDEGATTVHGSAGTEVTWSEDDASSAVSQRSLQRQSAAATSGSCGTTWSSSGPATSDPSPVLSAGFSLETCYRWVLTIEDPAGNEAQIASGVVQIGDVVLENPVAGQNVFDFETLVAQTSLPSVTSVEFIVGGTIVATDLTAPYEVAVDTTSMADGVYGIDVRVTQTGGATATTPTTQVIVANALGSQARLASDYAYGSISVDEFALNGVLAILSSGSTPSRYRTANPDPVSESLGAYLDLRPNLQQATTDAIDAFLAQPLRGSLYQPAEDLGQAEPSYIGCGNTHTSPAGNGYGSFTVTYCESDSVPSGGNLAPAPSHFKLIYVIGAANTRAEVDRQDDGADAADGAIADNGIPDLVDRAAAELEDAYQLYRDMGFDAPLPDGEQINVNFSAGGPTDNQASADFCGLGGITLNINPEGPLRLLRYAAPHELFHAFQFGYRRPCSVPWFEFHFWMEATANWATHRYVTHRRIVDPTFEPDNEWTGDVGAYLGTPDLELSAASPFGEGREYGIAVLAEYLSSQLPASPVLRSWQLIGEGQTAKQAISNVVDEAQAGSFPTFLAGWAKSAYQLSLTAPNPVSLVDDDLEAWQLAFEDYAIRAQHGSLTAEYTGPDGFGNHRPARSPFAIVPLDVTVTGESHLGEHGMSFVDLSPAIPDGDGFVTVTVQRPDENVGGMLVRYRFIDPNNRPAGTLPCGEPNEMLFGNNEGFATVEIDSSCPFATLMLVRFGPPSSFAFFGSPIKWSAFAWEPHG